MAAGQQGDDAIGLAQLLGAQHDGFISVEGHATFSTQTWFGSAPAHGGFQNVHE
jgi:hypothetical protein